MTIFGFGIKIENMVCERRQQSGSTQTTNLIINNKKDK